MTKYPTNFTVDDNRLREFGLCGADGTGQDVTGTFRVRRENTTGGYKGFWGESAAGMSRMEQSGRWWVFPFWLLATDPRSPYGKLKLFSGRLSRSLSSSGCSIQLCGEVISCRKRVIRLTNSLGPGVGRKGSSLGQAQARCPTVSILQTACGASLIFCLVGKIEAGVGELYAPFPHIRSVRPGWIVVLLVWVGDTLETRSRYRGRGGHASLHDVACRLCECRRKSEWGKMQNLGGLVQRGHD